jgi:hypothetical protein
MNTKYFHYLPQFPIIHFVQIMLSKVLVEKNILGYIVYD